MKRKNSYLLLGIPLLIGGVAGINYLGRSLVNGVFKNATKTIMTDKYDENLWEFVSASSRVGLQKIVEINLRAQLGRMIERPLGSPKQFPSLDNLMFSYAQINTMPTPGETEIDTSVVIGKKAKKPLYIETPIIISGMAYGFALSEQFRIALAKGASLAGTAVNTGEGGLLPKERQAAKKLILQYHRGHWSKKPEILRQADMIELQFGQGAIGGTFNYLEPWDITETMRRHFEVKQGERLVAHSRIPGINKPQDLIKKVKELRSITDGIPIGAKLGAGDELEQDIAWCLEADLDVIAIDGAEAASRGAPPTLLDDFGLPTLFALTRAVNYLEKVGAKDEIDLIISGKLITPGDFLKALALGANAVYIGTAALFATSHTQVLKPMPFEPPTQIAWFNGKYAHKFNIDHGAKSLANYLNSCTEEMKKALQALGKTSIHQLSKDDLVAVDPFVAEITGVKPAHLSRT